MSGRHFPTDAIVWHEGMLLAPQHFQQSVRRAEELVRYHAAGPHRHAWGAVGFRPDTDLELGVEKLTLHAFEGILQLTGLAVRLSSEEDSRLELDLGPPPKPGGLGQERVDVFLGVRRHDLGARAGRLMSESYLEQLTDESAPGSTPRSSEGHAPGSVAVSRARPRLALTLGSATSLVDYLRVAVLQSDGSDWTFADYEPPTMRMHRHARIHEISARLRDLTREKEAEIREQIRTTESLEGRQSVALRALLAGLGRGLPRLTALLASEGAPPFEVYVALCDVLGGTRPWVHELTPARTDFHYVHDDVVFAFKALENELVTALKSLGGEFDVRHFSGSAGNGFSLAEMPKDLPNWILIGGDSTGGSVVDWLSGAKIVSESRKDDVSGVRSLGVARERVWATDFPGIPAPPDMTLLLINLGDAPAGEVDRSGLIAPNEPLWVFRDDRSQGASPQRLRLFLPSSPPV